jgi:hypothetical protein
MDKKTYKCEIRISLPIDEVNLLEKLAEKEQKSKGEILLEFLSSSPEWIDKVAKWKQCIKEVV